MGWGIDFKADIYLSHQDYHNNIHQVQDEIDSLNRDLEIAKQQIMMFCIGTPKDLVVEETGSLVFTINNDVNELLNEIKESEIKIYQLELYKEYLTDKNNENKD